MSVFSVNSPYLLCPDLYLPWTCLFVAKWISSMNIDDEHDFPMTMTVPFVRIRWPAKGVVQGILITRWFSLVYAFSWVASRLLHLTHSSSMFRPLGKLGVFRCKRVFPQVRSVCTLFRRRNGGRGEGFSPQARSICTLFRARNGGRGEDTESGSAQYSKSLNERQKSLITSG